MRLTLRKEGLSKDQDSLDLLRIDKFSETKFENFSTKAKGNTVITLQSYDILEDRCLNAKVMDHTLSKEKILAHLKWIVESFKHLKPKSISKKEKKR